MSKLDLSDRTRRYENFEAIATTVYTFMIRADDGTVGFVRLIPSGKYEVVKYPSLVKLSGPYLTLESAAQESLR